MRSVALRAERLAGAALQPLVSTFVAALNTGAVHRTASGYSHLLATRPVGTVIGQALHRVGSIVEPDNLLVTRAGERLRSLSMGRVGLPGERLTVGEMAELDLRHITASVLGLALWVFPFIAGTNVRRLHLDSREVVTVMRRFQELLIRDMRNAGHFYPRRILSPTFADLDRAEVADAFRMTQAAMLRYVRSGRALTDPLPTGYPRYFRSAFHLRDWLRDDSARSYDIQTEALFSFVYGAMQRALIPSLITTLEQGAGRPQAIVDVGGGTGIFARYLLETLEWRRIRNVTLHFVELSPANMRLARSRLARWGDQVRFHDFESTGACAERLPLLDSELDAVVAINLFHVLPAHIRRSAAREFARVLKPREGRLFFLDSAQEGDQIDSFLHAFGGNAHLAPDRTTAFHEPFFPGYIKEDLIRLFAEVGLTPTGPVEYAYLAKYFTMGRVAPV
jgi:ubiquinone/menaquinone biosynthesis C-methylase UbiE